jgi:O-antigen ligase
VTSNTETPDARRRDLNPATVATLLAWTFGLAPALLFVLTWTDAFSPLQQMARAFALPVLVAQVVIIVVSFGEGVLLARPKPLPLALLAALGVLAWVTAARAALLPPSLIRTGIWTVQLGFALAVVNLWHHRMLDFERFRTAILAGFLLVFALLVAFVAITDPTYDEVIHELPAFGNVRWFGYFAAAAIGLAAPGFLRGDKTALLVGAAAFAAASWTGSRGAIIAAVVGLLACAIVLREFRPVRVWLRFSLCGLAGVALAYGLDALVPFEGQGPASLARYDDSFRIAIWKDTLDYILMRPLTGWGEGQFRFVLGDEWWVAQPHNVVLQVLLAWGFIGGLLCLALAIWVAPRFLKAQGAEAAPFQHAALVLAAYSLIDGVLFYAQSLSLFVFCCAAAVAAGLPRGAIGESLPAAAVDR